MLVGSHKTERVSKTELFSNSTHFRLIVRGLQLVLLFVEKRVDHLLNASPFVLRIIDFNFDHLKWQFYFRFQIFGWPESQYSFGFTVTIVSYRPYFEAFSVFKQINFQTKIFWFFALLSDIQKNTFSEIKCSGSIELRIAATYLIFWCNFLFSSKSFCDFFFRI